MQTKPTPEFWDTELVEYAVRYAQPAAAVSAPRWVCVAHVFGIGADQARALCQRFGIDPYSVVPSEN